MSRMRDPGWRPAVDGRGSSTAGIARSRRARRSRRPAPRTPAPPVMSQRRPMRGSARNADRACGQPEGTAVSHGGAEATTVVFCDLVGSSELSTRLDPEDLARLIGRFHRCVAATMGRYGGFFASPMGDAPWCSLASRKPTKMMPNAPSGPAWRRSTRWRDRAAGWPCAPVKIGIATGVAIVGDLVNAGSDRGLDASGEAPISPRGCRRLPNPTPFSLPKTSGGWSVISSSIASSGNTR